MSSRLAVSLSRSAVLLLALLSATAAAHAQSTSGVLMGTILDGSGGLVADATVTITSQDTRLTRTIKTGNAGRFVAPQLPPGRYDIAIEKSGFKRLIKTDVVLSATAQVNAGDFTLEVGELAEEVTVAADAGRIQIQSQSGERSGRSRAPSSPSWP